MQKCHVIFMIFLLLNVFILWPFKQNSDEMQTFDFDMYCHLFLNFLHFFLLLPFQFATDFRYRH